MVLESILQRSIPEETVSGKEPAAKHLLTQYGNFGFYKLS
jgi:hypothetical protein